MQLVNTFIKINYFVNTLLEYLFLSFSGNAKMMFCSYLLLNLNIDYNSAQLFYTFRNNTIVKIEQLSLKLVTLANTDLLLSISRYLRRFKIYKQDAFYDSRLLPCICRDLILSSPTPKDRLSAVKTKSFKARKMIRSVLPA